MGFTKAADFTMSSGYNNEGQGFSWVTDGIDFESYPTPREITQFVRDYVKGYISETNHTQASNATVYKVWRAQSGEFAMLCDHVAAYVESQYE